MKGPQSTSSEVAQSQCDTAVLGVGSFEQHSHHLPLETDFFFARRISEEVARRLDAFCLNPLPYSSSLEHRGFAGTVLLKPDTVKRVIWDIAQSVSDWGIVYLAVLNCHGGNFILNPAIREWNMEGRLPHTMLIDFYVGLAETGNDLHAGSVETSLMLYLAPEMVREELARDFMPEDGREDLTHFGMRAISPEGVWGYPSEATREKGERWFREAVEYCVGKIRGLKRRFDQLDSSRSE
jgi:creatinine amidohydrolase